VAETCRRVVQKEKLIIKVALKTDYFSVYAVYVNATGFLDTIVTVKKEHRLRVFENRVLRRILDRREMK
jgi:hypothetical protein